MYSVIYISLFGFGLFFFQENAVGERAKEGVLQNSPLKLFFPGPRINVRGGLWNTTSQRITVKQTWPTTVILPTLRAMQHCTGTTNAVQNTSCFSVSWHLGACWFNLSALNWILTIEKCNLPSCYKVKHMHNLFCCLPFPVRVSLWQTSWFGPFSVCYPRL